MNVYLDSAIVIYIVEQPPGFGATVNRAIHLLSPSNYTCTDLTRCESMILPRRNGDVHLEWEFEWYFRQSFIKFQEFNRSVFNRTIELRSKYRFLKTPDALHVASALEASCDIILTNDIKLAAISEIPVHLI